MKRRPFAVALALLSRPAFFGSGSGTTVSAETAAAGAPQSAALDVHEAFVPMRLSIEH